MPRSVFRLPELVQVRSSTDSSPRLLTRVSARLAAVGVALACSVGVSPSALAAEAAAPERVSRGNDRPLAQPEGTQRFLVPTPLRDTAYMVQVLVPSGAAPEGCWPVLYAMDGKAIFDVLATHADAAPHNLNMVVVCVSYDSPCRIDFRARSYDYTPPSPGADAPVGLPRDPNAQGRVPPGGGAETFLKFLLSDIEPALSQRVRIDTSERSLYGHSYGGLFVLYAYLSEPQRFAHYLAASPSLWWNRQALMSKLPGESVPAGQRGSLTVMVGEGEGSADVAGSAVGTFSREVARQPGARVWLEVMPGLGHGPMMPASWVRTLERLRPSGEP